MASLGRAAVDQHGVWERIAQSFAETRQRPWPHVERFLHRTAKDARILDVMCGNGRHMKIARRDAIGLDFSRPLAAAASEHGPAVAGDATTMPFADGVFDAAVYVAGLHGIPDAADRAASLQELHRVLRPGAEAQVTVWFRDAPRFAAMDLPRGPADVTVPWRRNGMDEPRFYHLYTQPELQAACEAAGFEVLSIDPIAIAEAEPDNLVAWLRKARA